MRRIRVRILLVVAGLVVVLGVAGLPVYAFPHVDAPRHVDAIFVLGGAGGETRYRYALDLAQDGYADQVVMSNPNGTLAGSGLCRPRPGIWVDCFDPDPSTTRGEAQMLRRVAAERGWRSVMVVTFRPHVARARYVVQRCWRGDLTMVMSPQRISPLYWPFAYVYQTAGYLRAALQDGC